MKKIKLVEIKKTQLASLLNDSSAIEFTDEDVNIKFLGTGKENLTVKLYISFEVEG